MTACSFQEEKEWRARLSRPWNEDESGREANIFTSLELDMKHLGAVYGKPGKSKLYKHFIDFFLH